MTNKVRPIDANNLARRIREYMDTFPHATTRLAACRAVLSMLGDEGQTPTLTTRINREAWEPCELCGGDKLDGVGIGDRFGLRVYLSGGRMKPPENERVRFCPWCGRPLTDESVNIIMQRLEELKNA